MDSDLIGLDSSIGGRLNKFKVKELNRPQRFSFVWWPAMELAEYSGEMSVDMLIELYQRSITDKSYKGFYSPVFLDRYQAFIPGGVGYVQLRTAEEVAEAVKVFDDLKMQAPKFQRKASTYVVEWPITKNGMKTQFSAILEDWDPEVQYVSLTDKNYRGVQQLHNMGKLFTENDIIATCSEGPLTYQKWAPMDITQSTFCLLIQMVQKGGEDERSLAARKILQDILKVVANRSKKAKDLLLEQLGQNISPQQLRSKLLAGNTSPALAQAIEETAGSIDVEGMLSSLEEE